MRVGLAKKNLRTAVELLMRLRVARATGKEISDEELWTVQMQIHQAQDRLNPKDAFVRKLSVEKTG